MEEDCGQRWTTWFLLKEGIKLTDIHCRLSALFGEQALCSAGYRTLSSGMETAQTAVHNGIAATLRNDSMKSTTNSHIDSSDV